MAVNGYIIFNRANTDDIYFENKAVKSVYYGSTLVWEKIQNILRMDSEDKYVCIEFIPTTDITVNSVEFFVEGAGAYGPTYILNECGLCVGVQLQPGITTTTIYGLTANLVTASSFGSPTLLAGRKYYLAYKWQRWDNDSGKFSYYQNQTGHYKLFHIDGGMTKYTTYDLSTVPCVGSINHMGQLNTSNWAFTPSDFYNSECANNTLFVWKGGYVNGTFTASYYPVKTNRDMRNVKVRITDAMLSACNSDMQRLALIYYMIGNDEGAELIWGANSNYQQGIKPNGVNMFYDGAWKIYKATGNIVNNHITSMTPVTREPTTKVLGDVYYKDVTTASDGWKDANNNPITQQMVVAWNGSAWEFASNWRYEFDTDSDYTGETCATVIQDWIAESFNNVDVSTDKRYYLRINNIEV